MQYITDVHSITTAVRGWKTGSTEKPVVCWALVTVTNSDFPASPDKKIIPIVEENVNSPLIGEQVDPVAYVEFDPD